MSVVLITGMQRLSFELALVTDGIADSKCYTQLRTVSSSDLLTICHKETKNNAPCAASDPARLAEKLSDCLSTKRATLTGLLV